MMCFCVFYGRGLRLCGLSFAIQYSLLMLAKPLLAAKTHAWFPLLCDAPQGQ